MDHLAKVHGIEKDTKHPTIISRQQKKARDECKTRALDADMSESDSNQFAPRGTSSGGCCLLAMSSDRNFVPQCTQRDK